MGIGNNIKNILKEKNKTLVWLSGKADISVNTLYGITKKNVTTVRKETLEKIAAALEVSEAELLKDNERKTRIFNPAEEIDTSGNFSYIFDPNNTFSETSKQILAFQKMSEKGFIEEFCNAYDLTKEEAYQTLIGPRDKMDEESYQEKIAFYENLPRAYAVNIIYQDQLEALNNFFYHLNYNGRREALKRMEELTLLSKYAKND